MAVCILAIGLPHLNPRLQTKQETFAVNIPKLKNKLEEVIKGLVGIFKYCNVHCFKKYCI